MNSKTLLTLAILLATLLTFSQIGLVSACEGSDCPPPDSNVSITAHKFNDTNGNGTQDEGEANIEGWYIRIYRWTIDTGYIRIAEGYTDSNGNVTFGNLDSTLYKVWEEQRDCWTPTTPSDMNNWSDDDHPGYYTLVQPAAGENATVNFGNKYTCSTPPTNPGTGTPGYWKNHPEAWPVDSITIGGVTYSKAEALNWLGQDDKEDKTITLFRALVSAKLNVLIGNDDSCIADTINQADDWMASYGPVGSGVKAGGKDSPWRSGEPLYLILDDYNNGNLCAPPRD